MKFESISIKQAIIDIESGKIFLPPIQRNFVWDKKRIINLFDSLYRNYPIGNCIFWKLKPETSQNYPLYKFIQEYSENKSKPSRNEKVSSNLLKNDVFAVVDGQQRLSSLFFGLAGTYKYKKVGKGLRNIETSFIKSKLYINLLINESKIHEEEEELFEFLSEENCSVLNERNLWFEVGKMLTWTDVNQVDIFITETLEPIVNNSKRKTLISKFNIRKDKISSILKSLYGMLNENRLYYFDIDNQKFDTVVDMFTRVNSGGITLKKSDLLFSILVSQWNEGRDEIKDLVETLVERNINISHEFVMRACLVLSDLPVKYKLESFTLNNINIIKKNWGEIKNSLIGLCDFLPEIGYIDGPNLSENALIPIAYYIKCGGNTKTQKAKKSLQQYYVVSQVNKIFGGQGDQVLEKIIAEIRQQLAKDNSLNYQRLADLKLPGNKTMKITSENLEYLVANTSYYSPHAYFLLSLIYLTLDYKIRRYQVDHIHPKSRFNPHNFGKEGILDEKIRKDWMNKRDLLPNLELLGRDNQTKGAKPVVDFLKVKTKSERMYFMKENLLPTDLKLLELKKFDVFYEFRKRLIIKKLKRHFGI